MAEQPPQPPPEGRITDAASETIARGVDIRERVHDLTLHALKDRSFDRDGIQDVIRAVTQGVALGADRDRVDMRQAMSEALSGLDKALRTSAEAGQMALKELASTGRDFSDTSSSRRSPICASSKRISSPPSARLPTLPASGCSPSCARRSAAARRSGTETGRQVARVMSDFAQRFSVASLDATVSGLEMASEFGARFAELASGVLSGLADALRTQKTERDEPPKSEQGT